MTALISAELLRLRTLSSPLYIVLGGLAIVVAIAAMNVDPGATGDSIGDSLRTLAIPGVLIPAMYAGSNIGTEFQRGAAAMTYLSHPRRSQVTAARALTYAGLGFMFAGLAAAAIVAVGLTVAGAGASGLSATDGAQLIGGAAAGGAIMTVAGVLLGTVTRNPMVASSGLAALSVVESLVSAAGDGPHLPFELVGGVDGRERFNPGAGRARHPARLPRRVRPARPPMGTSAGSHMRGRLLRIACAIAFALVKIACAIVLTALAVALFFETAIPNAIDVRACTRYVKELEDALSARLRTPR
jgi:hypothetical protein